MDFIDIAGGGKKLTIECKDSNKNTLATKTYTIIKNEYSKTLPAIEGYIPEQETISGEITGDTTKEVLYYYVIPETQMVFTGLDSSGNITTDSSQIVSYMVGNNSSTNGNGLVLAPTVLSALIIPETHEGKPIIKVGNNGFRDIKKIGILNIGNSVTSIGQSAIYTCTAMKKLIIGSGLNSIGTNAFAGCGALKTIIYNNETTVIKSIAYTGNNWTEIQINDDNNKLKVIDNVLYSKDGSTIIRVPEGKDGNFIVMEGVTNIAESAFYQCTKITEINIGNNVTSIGKTAMLGCSGMKKLIIGSGLSSIGTNAFAGCGALKTIIYNNETTVIKSIAYTGNNWTEIQINDDNNKLKVIDNVLYSKDGSTIIRVPEGKDGNFIVMEGVTNIAESAFYQCTKITEINIGNNVTSIGKTAMLGCSGMKKLIIGSGLSSIGTNAFAGCSVLKTVIIDSSTIASNLTSQSSYASLIQNATTVYTKITPGSYITSNFHIETTDIEGYTKYVKN